MNFHLIRTLIFFVLFMLFIPINYFIRHEPFLIWQLNKNDPRDLKQDQFHLAKAGALKKYFFRKKGMIHFINSAGEAQKSYSLGDNAKVTYGTGESGVIYYLKDGEKIFFLDRDKGTTWNFETYAYPFMTGNESCIMLITGENGGYSLLDPKPREESKFIASGSLLVSYSVAFHTNRIAAGFINGSVMCHNSKMDTLWEKRFKESQIPLVKKVAVSPRGEYVACLAGLNQEYLYVMDQRGKLVTRHMTGDERRRPMELVFSMDSRFLLEESERGFRLYKVGRTGPVLEKNIFEKSPDRKMTGMDVSHDGEMILLSYKMDGMSCVELYAREGSMLYRLLFDEKNVRVLFSKDKYSFFIETGDTIYLYGI